ncbi:hypothetical protein ACOSP7_031105 [Xanthoceras sorbifolium]
MRTIFWSSKGRNFGLQMTHLWGLCCRQDLMLRLAERHKNPSVERSGVGKPSIVPGPHQHMQEHGPEMVFLSETLPNSIQMDSLRRRLGLCGKLSVDRMGRKGSLGLMWSDKVTVSIISYSNFYIDVLIQSEDTIT